MTVVNGIKREATFKMVLYIPGLGTNLLSIAAVTEVGITVHFVESSVTFNKNNAIVTVGKRIGRRLYHLHISVNQPLETAYFVAPTPPSIEVWHQPLAHDSYGKILTMASSKSVDGLILPENSVSPSESFYGSATGKMERSPFQNGRTRALQVGQLIHTDMFGPMHVATSGGSKYFFLFTDDYSGFRTVYFLKQKSKIAENFRKFSNFLWTDTRQTIHTLRSDNGGEFIRSVFRSWLSEKRIMLETSEPPAPEQNGVSERANRTIMEGSRCLIHAKHLPVELWGEAIACAVYTLNRVTTKAAPKTSFQNWYGSKPDFIQSTHFWLHRLHSCSQS